jgi:hypothetical protein
MDDRRPGPDRDRILVAQLTGTARHHAKWRELTGDEEAAAVTELRELATGRGDLLAEVAGIFEGTSEGELDEPVARQAAGLCRQAGADPEAIPAWAEEGRRRRAAASMPPFSGGLHGTGAPGRPRHPGLTGNTTAYGRAAAYLGVRRRAGACGRCAPVACPGPACCQG